MTRDALPEDYHTESGSRISQFRLAIPQSQETIYRFFLGEVKSSSPQQVLAIFKKLFIQHNFDETQSELHQALDNIIFANNEEEFRNTLKRCCYILINNWEAERHHQSIQDLVNLFEDPVISQITLSPFSKRLRQWTNNFISSPDYEEIKLFAHRSEEVTHQHWSQRYTSYLLVPQYIDANNSAEQREAAKARAQQLKEKFKFDLAMYTAHSQLGNHIAAGKTLKNPTALGDEVLRLIKIILSRRGPFNYANLANIFLNQVQQLPYKDFKNSLQEYLVFGLGNQEFSNTLKIRLSEHLQDLYIDYHDKTITPGLILRTCNRTLEYLTVEAIDKTIKPSSLFILLLSQGNPLMLVIVIVKIILISKASRTHLEAKVAELIKYYQDYPEQDCKWVIDFMEILNIAFAIYAENVRYNLIRMDSKKLSGLSLTELDQYRVFSQMHDGQTIEDSSPEKNARLSVDFPEEFDLEDF